MTINTSTKIGLNLPTDGNTSWGQAIRDNFTNLENVLGSYQFAENKASHLNLSFAYFGGAIVINEKVAAVVNGSITLPDNATSFIEAYIDPTGNGIIEANQTGWTKNRVALFEVGTATGQIATVKDFRSWLRGIDFTDIENQLNNISGLTASLSQNSTLHEEVVGAAKFGFNEGKIVIGNKTGTVAAGSVAVVDNATNYLEAYIDSVDNLAKIAVNQTGFTKNRIPLFIVVASNGIFTSVTDVRAWLSAEEKGIDTFLGLIDTPDTFTEKSGQFVKVNAGGTGLEFSPDDNGNALTIQGKVVPVPTATEDQKVLAYDLATDAFKYVAAGSGGGDTTALETRISSAEVELGTYTPTVMAEDFEKDYLNLPFTGDWAKSTLTPYQGLYSFKSKAIGHNGISKTTIENVQFDVDGDISFYYRVSSEANCDFIKFLVDGVEKLKTSGEVAWTLLTVPITAGVHTFEWQYTKDGSAAVGEDAAYIDNVAITNGTVQPGNTLKQRVDGFSDRITGTEYELGINQPATGIMDGFPHTTLVANGAYYTGWHGNDFTPKNTMEINKLEYQFYTTSTTRVSLWDVATQTKLKEWTVPNATTERAVYDLPESITLEANVEYFIAAYTGHMARFATYDYPMQLTNAYINNCRRPGSAQHQTDAFPTEVTTSEINNWFNLQGGTVALKSRVRNLEAGSNASKIQGKTVPVPTATEDQKALVYDAATDAFVYATATGGTNNVANVIDANLFGYEKGTTELVQGQTVTSPAWSTGTYDNLIVRGTMQKHIRLNSFSIFVRGGVTYTAYVGSKQIGAAITPSIDGYIDFVASEDIILNGVVDFKLTMSAATNLYRRPSYTSNTGALFHYGTTVVNNTTYNEAPDVKLSGVEMKLIQSTGNASQIKNIPVDVTGILDGYSLVYDAALGKFVGKPKQSGGGAFTSLPGTLTHTQISLNYQVSAIQKVI